VRIGICGKLAAARDARLQRARDAGRRPPCSQCTGCCVSLGVAVLHQLRRCTSAVEMTTACWILNAALPSCSTTLHRERCSTTLQLQHHAVPCYRQCRLHEAAVAIGGWLAPVLYDSDCRDRSDCVRTAM
jgi:hypothetical protein